MPNKAIHNTFERYVANIIRGNIKAYHDESDYYLKHFHEIHTCQDQDHALEYRYMGIRQDDKVDLSKRYVGWKLLTCYCVTCDHSYWTCVGYRCPEGADWEFLEA